jgi:uncharacterized protein (TIGR03000 family)
MRGRVRTLLHIHYLLIPSSGPELARLLLFPWGKGQRRAELMIDDSGFGDRARSIISMRARSPILEGGTDMFHFARMKMLALAGLGVLLVAGPARAQQGWPINGSNWSYYGGSGRGGSSWSSGRYSRSYYSPSYSSPRSYVTYPYYSTSAAELPSTRRVTVNLQVPGDAKIWFNGSQTKQTGTTRSFESPPLKAGREYAYEMRVQWKRDGKDVTDTRKIAVHAGDVINLNVGTTAEVSAVK